MPYEIPTLLPNVLQVELFIENHPGLTTKEISEALALPRETIATNTSRLRAEGRVRREFDEETGRIRWHPGVEDGVTPQSEKELGQPKQTTVTEWEPVRIRKQSWVSSLGL